MCDTKSWNHTPAVLGSFIHAILQPILGTLKAGRSHNGEVHNSDTWFVFVDQSYTTLMFLCYQHICGLFFISEMTAEHLIFLEANQRWHQRHVGVHRPRGASRRSKTCSSSWWRARMASTVCLLILVRKTQKWFTNLCHFSQYVIYKNRSLHQEQKFPPVQVIEGWEEDRVHCGRGQHISC